MCDNSISPYEKGVTDTYKSLPLVMKGKWVLGADIVPPAKPARRLSAHVPLSYGNVGEISARVRMRVV